MLAVQTDISRIAKILALFLLVAICLGTHAHGNERVAVYAHGAADRYWIAQTFAGTGADGKEAYHTTIHTRLRSDGKFTAMGDIKTRVERITNLGPELVMLLANGDWNIYFGTESRSGVAVPGNHRIIALAGESNALHVITTIRQDATTTAPASQPTEDSGALGSFTFQNGKWTQNTDLPAEIQARTSEDLFLAFTNGKLLLAVRTAPETLSLWQRNGDTWQRIKEIQSSNEIAQFELLDVQDTTRLWITNGRSPGVLYRSEQNWENPEPLVVQADAEAPYAIAVHSTLIRLLFTHDKQLHERAFSYDGQPGDERELDLAAYVPQPVPTWQSLFFIGLLIYVMLSVVRSRPTTVNPENLVEQHGVEIAPLMRRMLAGLIDLIPYLAGMVYIFGHPSPEQSRLLLLEEPWVQVLILVAAAIYIAHTVIIETFWGRSIGKIIMGLQVIQIDGKKPSRVTLMTRNLLRVLDLIAFPLPLLTVIYTPLRQRIADLAAGTVVVVTAKQLPPNDPQQ